MVEQKIDKVVSPAALIDAIRSGAEKARAGEITATFVLAGVEVTLRAIENREVINAMTSAGPKAVAQLMKESNALKGGQKGKRFAAQIAKLRLQGLKIVEQEAQAAALAEYIVDIRDPKVSDDEQSFITLAWIVKLGIHIDGYVDDGAVKVCPFDSTLSPFLLQRSTEFHLWVSKNLSDVAGFYKEKQEAELGNSESSHDGEPAKTPLIADSVSKPNLKSPAEQTSGTVTEKKPD